MVEGSFAAPCPGRRQLSPAVQADQGYAEAKQASRESRLGVLREAEVVVSTLIAAGGDLLSLSAGQPGFDAIIIDEVSSSMRACSLDHIGSLSNASTRPCVRGCCCSSPDLLMGHASTILPNAATSDNTSASRQIRQCSRQCVGPCSP